MKQNLFELIKTLPKAELHIHLEGAISSAVIQKLAQKYSHLEFARELEKLQNLATFKDFKDFRSYYRLCMQLLRSADDFALVTYEYGRDMIVQNILYSEVYISIYQHIHLFNKSLSFSDILDGLERGRQKAAKDFGIEIQWIFGIPRSRHFSGNSPKVFDPTIAATVLEYALQGQEYGVIGIGLGGNEVNAPPHPFKDIFQKARKMGLRSIPHAGETSGANSIWGAINELEADRICHGVRAIEDKKLLKELIDRQIPLDICPTSNLMLNLYPSIKEHPFFELDKSGVLITINSDDPSLFGSSLCDEYAVIARAFNYEINDLLRFAKNSFNASCLAIEAKENYLYEVEKWEKVNLSVL
ncbi:MAG: adenosine deaminase [Chloroflexi bacterium]|nr:adenosine deaminase [Chloroflexota bacterium]